MDNRLTNMIAIAVLIVLIFTSVCFFKSCSDEDAKEIRSRILEKYGESISYVMIEKDWKNSESDYTCYNISARSKEGTTFQILQESLKNDYNRTYWRKWMEDTALQIGKKHFDQNFNIYVNIVSGWTDTLPGVDQIIPYEEFIEKYCDSTGTHPNNMIRFDFNTLYSAKGYEAFLQDIATSDLIFDSLLLIYKDYRVELTYDEVNSLAENYDESKIESLKYTFEY